jgi:hypothetical protein
MHVTLAVLKVEIDPILILYDSESSVDIFKNKQMITNIRKSKKPIRLKGTEGNTIKVDEEGDLLGYGSVYYNSHVTYNASSFFNTAKKIKSLVIIIKRMCML